MLKLAMKLQRGIVMTIASARPARAGAHGVTCSSFPRAKMAPTLATWSMKKVMCASASSLAVALRVDTLVQVQRDTLYEDMRPQSCLCIVQRYLLFLFFECFPGSISEKQ